MHKIPFTQNWNGKLFLNCFGTVRLYNPEKYFEGNKLELQLKNHEMGIVEVVAVRKFRYDQISGVLSYLDIGRPPHYLADIIKRFYSSGVKVDKDLLLHHVVLKYTYRNLSVHAMLLEEWWQEQLQKQPISA